MDDSRDRDVRAFFPFVLVRLACGRCTRTGAYRLARLAVKYGAEIDSGRTAGEALHGLLASGSKLGSDSNLMKLAGGVLLFSTGNQHHGGPV
jgi:hypothetical protein